MPTPQKGESRGDYVARCIRIRRQEHPDEKQTQSIAACFGMWKQHKTGKSGKKP